MARAPQIPRIRESASRPADRGLAPDLDWLFISPAGTYDSFAPGERWGSTASGTRSHSSSVLPRRSLLCRQSAVERSGGASPVLVLTKVVDPEKLDVPRFELKHPGLRVLACAALEGVGLAELRALLAGIRSIGLAAGADAVDAVFPDIDELAGGCAA